jgi:regulator of cell morphogenesis and NO signaling
VLFPFFEKNTGFTRGGPTEVMRQEHRQIGESLETLHKKVQQSDPNSDEQEKQILNLLASHNNKEENILYPSIDALAKEPGKIEEIFQAMRDIREERYLTCCKTE